MILLFGGAGQLGQEITHAASRRNIELTGLSRAQADISDPRQVADAIRSFRPAFVINAAAYTDVDQAESDYDAALLANARGPEILAVACRDASVPLIHFSTDYVFDGTKAGSYSESDPIEPIGAYGRSKAIGEDMVRSNHAMHLILRTSWVYGVFGSNFLKTILRLSKERQELRIVADQHGNPTSTAQIADAIFAIAPGIRDRTGPWGTYHFTGSGTTTWHDFAKRIVDLQARYTNRRPPVVPIRTEEYPTRARRPANSALDCSRFVRTFGITPETWTTESERAIAAVFSS
jgi:dTDP-4-dehydrorhamnose reductase